MKKYFLSIIVLAFHTILHSQVVASFDMPLYFEDAKGNKDTVIFGYSNLSHYDNILSVLGEDVDNSALNEVFDVRICKSSTFWNTPFLGKKRIAFTGKDSICQLFGGLYIVVNAKHNPVKVTYDPTLLNTEKNLCLQNTVLDKHGGVGLVQFWWETPEKSWFCLASQKELSLDTREMLIIDPPIPMFYTKKYEVQGLGIKEIPFFRLLNFLNGPCEYYVNNKDVTENTNFSIYPNPTTGILNIATEEAFEILEIFDLSGKTVFQQQQPLSTEVFNIDISHLPDGLYIVKLTDKNGRSNAKKILKVE